MTRAAQAPTRTPRRPPSGRSVPAMAEGIPGHREPADHPGGLRDSPRVHRYWNWTPWYDHYLTPFYSYTRPGPAASASSACQARGAAGWRLTAGSGGRAAFPGWEILAVEAAETAGLGWPMSRTAPARVIAAPLARVTHADASCEQQRAGQAPSHVP